jgi:uncharacterized membrane protein YccF (DUF307 family)
MSEISFTAGGTPDMPSDGADSAAAPLPAVPTEAEVAAATQAAPPTPVATTLTTTVNVTAPSVVVMQEKHGPGFGTRALWYLFVGWWLTQLALLAGYLAGLTLVGLPLAFWIFNRTGTLLTLRPRSQTTTVEQQGSVIVVRNTGIEQHPLWARALYFVLVGWWLALLWMELAWLLSLTMIGIPLSIMMLNRLPAVYTLQRN